MKILRQSTAATPGIGPFVDTSGAAATGLTIAQTDVILSKGGTTTYAAKNDATSATHRSGGVYSVPLDATDTGTLGPLTIVVNETGALPLRDVWTVVPANVYDSLVSTDKLQVDAVEINSSSAAAVRQALAAGVMIPGTVFNDSGTYAASTTVFYSDDVTEATADHYIGRRILFTSGALLGQATAITDYSLTAATYGTLTVSALTEAPADNVTFLII